MECTGSDGGSARWNPPSPAKNSNSSKRSGAEEAAAAAAAADDAATAAGEAGDAAAIAVTRGGSRSEGTRRANAAAHKHSAHGEGGRTGGWAHSGTRSAQLRWRAPLPAAPPVTVAQRSTTSADTGGNTNNAQRRNGHAARGEQAKVVTARLRLESDRRTEHRGHTLEHPAICIPYDGTRTGVLL